MNCCALFSVTRGGVNVRRGGGVRQSGERAVTVCDRSRRRVPLCCTSLGMKFTVMKRTFSCLRPPLAAAGHGTVADAWFE